GAEAAGPPNFSLVEVIGCLTPGPNQRWTLTNASEPMPTKDETATQGALAGAASKPLGSQTFDLVSVSPSMSPESHRTHKVAARGLLYRDSKYAELNLTALDEIGTTCTR
ncbi:MAG TPA: hypothetical protein VKY31_11985, partial [Terriglobia bacterium]|nr:hypothetical protein [Terriglobia bacterium]